MRSVTAFCWSLLPCRLQSFTAFLYLHFSSAPQSILIKPLEMWAVSTRLLKQLWKCAVLFLFIFLTSSADAAISISGFFTATLGASSAFVLLLLVNRKQSSFRWSYHPQMLSPSEGLLSNSSGCLHPEFAECSTFSVVTLNVLWHLKNILGQTTASEGLFFILRPQSSTDLGATCPHLFSCWEHTEIMVRCGLKQTLSFTSDGDRTSFVVYRDFLPLCSNADSNR